MYTRFDMEMAKRGFSKESTESIRKFKCPVCNFEFSMLYGRTFACQGCSKAVSGCPKLRCPKCDCEFWIKETPQVKNEIQQRIMADHICKAVNEYRDRRGLVGNR